MQCIDTLSANDLKGKRVLVRSDFNSPLNKKGEVADLFRLKRGWETVSYLAERGARVIIVSHIGRDPEESMEPVARAAKALAPLVFVPDLVGHLAHDAAAAMRDGEVMMLENLRREAGETANDETFAKKLASLADMYVDDAFAAAHRAHASIVGVPKYLPNFAGLLVRDELSHLEEARTPGSPSFAILGGAKFETKAPLIQLLLERYDRLLIVGALANDVFKAKGFQVGRSLISKELPGENVLSNPRLVVPLDATVEEESGQGRVKRANEVAKGDTIVDIGPDSIMQIAPLITEAKFILWNGPTGMYEKGYTHYTQSIAELLAGSSAKKVIGGGDTVAAIEGSKVSQENLGFLSTGGGAMLEYLLKGTLPGIEALA